MSDEIANPGSWTAYTLDDLRRARTALDKSK